MHHNVVEDDTATWDDFLGADLRLNNVKTYMYLRVRLLFDPPQTSYLITAVKEQFQEIEWRLNAQREADAWVPSVERYYTPVGMLADGGDAG